MVHHNAGRLFLAAFCALTLAGLTACGSSGPTPQELADRVVEEQGITGVTTVTVKALHSNGAVIPSVGVHGWDATNSPAGGQATGDYGQALPGNLEPLGPIDHASIDYQAMYDKAFETYENHPACAQATFAAANLLTNWRGEQMTYLSCEDTYLPGTLSLNGYAIPDTFGPDAAQLTEAANFLLVDDQVWGITLTPDSVSMTGNPVSNGYEPHDECFSEVRLPYYDAAEEVDPEDYEPGCSVIFPMYTDAKPGKPWELMTLPAAQSYSFSQHLPAIVAHREAVVNDVKSLGGTELDVKDTTAMVYEDGKLHLVTPVTDPYKTQVTAEQHTIITV